MDVLAILAGGLLGLLLVVALIRIAFAWETRNPLRWPADQESWRGGNDAQGLGAPPEGGAGGPGGGPGSS